MAKGDALMRSHALAFLVTAQNADGGWGYAPGEASTVEATAAVSLALKDDPGGADLSNDAIA